MTTSLPLVRNTNYLIFGKGTKLRGSELRHSRGTNFIFIFSEHPEKIIKC